MTTTNPNGVEVVTETPVKIEESKASPNQCGKHSTNASGVSAKEDEEAYCGKMSMGLMACIAFVAIAAIGGGLGVICGATDICSGGMEDVAADGSNYYYYGNTMPTPEPTVTRVLVTDDSCFCNYGVGCDLAYGELCYFDDADQTTCSCDTPSWFDTTTVDGTTTTSDSADEPTPKPTPKPITTTTTNAYSCFMFSPQGMSSVKYYGTHASKTWKSANDRYEMGLSTLGGTVTDQWIVVDHQQNSEIVLTSLAIGGSWPVGISTMFTANPAWTTTSDGSSCPYITWPNGAWVNYCQDMSVSVYEVTC